MATYEQLYTVLAASVESQPLWRRAYVAILKAATDIRGEDAGTSNHANRLIWAAEAEQDTADKVREMKERIMENATIQADPNGATDNDVAFVVNSLIDTFATGS